MPRGAHGTVHSAELEGLVRDVRAAVGVSFAVGGAGEPAELLQRLWEEVVTASERDGLSREARTCLLDLLTRIRAAEKRLSAAAPECPADVLRRVLADMRGIRDTRQLLEEAPELVARLGFDRILVSFIIDDIWVPETIFLRRDPAWARDIVTAGRDEPTALDGVLIETEVARHGASLVVDDVQTNPRVHRPIAVISRSDNYGVAPIRIGGGVAAMLHADYYFQGRPVRKNGTDLLHVVGEVLGTCLDRTTTLERVSAARREADRAWAGLGDAGPWPWGEPAAPTPVLAPPVPPPAATWEELTPREAEILALMAEGETNHRIGRLLNITEGTVKTHVKHVLRKLGAANRAEAVSRWLRAG